MLYCSKHTDLSEMHLGLGGNVVEPGLSQELLSHGFSK